MSQRENGRSSSSRGDLANRLLYSGAGSAAKKGMMGRGGGGAGISGGGFRLQKKQQPSVSAPMMDGAVPKESGNIFGRTTTIAAPPAPKWPGIKGNGELLSEAALRSDEQSVGVGLAVAHVGLASDASIAPPHIGSIRPPGSSSENSRASRESSAMKLEGITPRKPALPSPPASASAAAKMGDRGRPHASSLLERLKLDPLWRDPFSDPSVFLYLKPISRNPYSLCIVGAADAQVPGASFYTLSANGLVLSRDGRTTFLTLEQFEREYYVYHKIASLPFFRSYPKWKSFVEWKGHVRARKRARCVARLEESLFILNPPLRSGLLQLMSLKHDVSKLKLFKAHLAEVQLQEFCTVQASQRAVVGAALSEFLANVRSAVLQACDNSLAEFLESAGFALPSMGAQFNIRDALLRIVEDLTPSEMSFTERAAVRTQCRRLAKFIRVVDCIVADTHLSLALSSTCSFVAAMLARSSRIPTANLQGLGPFRSLEPEKDDGCSADSNFSSSSPPSVPMFQLSVSTAALAEDLEGGKNSPRSHRGYLSIEPPEVTFHVDMEASLFESLTIVRYPPCLLWDPAFRAFVQPLTDDGTFSEHCDVKRDLESAIMVNPDFLRALEDAHVAVERAYRYCLEFVACFEPLIAKARSNADFLRNVTIDSFVGASVQDLSMILQQHSLEVKDFKRIKLSQDLGLVKLSTGRLESLLRPSAERCLGGIHRLVPELFSRKQEELLTSFTSSYDVLRFPLRSVEGFIDLTRSLRRIKREWRDTEESWDFLRQLQAAMESAALQMSDELKMQTSMTKKMRDQLLAKVEEVDDHYDADLRNYSTALTRQIDGLAPKMAHIMLELGHGMLDNPDASIQQVLQHLENCEVQVSKLVAHADQLQEWASVLKMDAIDREGLEEVCEEMRRKARLWRGLDSFQNKHRQWLRSQWHDLDVGDIESEISRFWHIVQLSERQLASNPVVGLFRDKVKQVKDAMPVIANLRSDSLQERHRAAIDALIGIDVSQRTRMSFQEVLQRNLQDVSDEIAAIATEAEQEATLLRGLKKVEDVWEDMEFTIIPHKSREECRVLGSVELVTDQLDDSLVAISNILASPYVSPIRAKVEDVHGLLLHFDKTLDEWLKLQKTWMHLEAIFSAPDIQKQLANEWGVVSSVDAFWRELMRRAATIRICLKVGAIPCIYDNISKHNLELEGVAKGLAEFIKLKRQAFPRFYFLSDEELLQLLSSCRDPQAIQPHLEKCFEGIHSLRFGEGVFSTSILAMVSREGEEVPLGPNLKARGAIEEWLTAVDDSAKSGLRRLVKASLSELRAATTGDDRACWLLSGIPAMVSQCCSAVEWSERVERVLSQVGSSDKQAALESIKSDCEGDLISVIDRINGDLSPLQRLTAVAHVTQRVHVRDVTQMLIDQSVDSASSFQWQAQVRLYWDDQSSSVLAHHSNFSIPCGYEYQGAVPRLIVTPLTERCWLTITGALSARLGANPIGPAGTGKTESTKDLARTLGMQCIVFNCSEQVDCGTMSHLLRGVAQSGAWICLDEFNRIDIEVLSVIGQQLMIIRQARLAGADEMMFEGQLLVLKEHHVIATMNPGYEGRTELPNNLKACYRPVAMMVPDYTLIAEVILLSEGFKDAQTLSTKVTALASLCSEQLSRQPHYDFGMRAVKNVLLLGGECKRCQPDLLESTILMRALRSSTAPKLLGMDVPLFDAILCDLFPNQSRTEAGNSALRMCIRGAVEASRGSLQEIPAQVAKVEQLNETLQARMGVALVGEEGTGKTTCYEILACALKGLRDARRSSTVREKWSAIQTQVLNPKVVTAGDLFGRYNEYTHEWRDGIASFLIRRAVEATANDDDVCQWIVFDGPIDTLWVENLNSVLDDNAVLCLASGERMKLNPGRIRLLFEVMSLDAASPATVSRLGVVFIPLSRPPPLQEVFSSWLAGDRLLECLEGEGMEPGAASILRRRLAFLAERVAIPLIVEMDRRREVYAEAVPAGPVQRISSACSLFEGLLSQLRRLYAMAGILQVQRSEGPRPALPFYLSEAVCDQAFIFSITWGLGGGLLGDHALAFDVFLRDLLTGDGLRGCVTLPPAGSVFDYYIHFSSQGRAYEWRPWSSAAPRLTHLPTDSLHEVMIPTGITAAYSYLVETSMAVQRPVFVTGHGGVGKTMLLRNLLRRRSKDHTAGPLESLVNSMGIKPGPGTEELSTCTATESWRSISSHLGGTSEWLSRDLLPFRAHPVLVALSARTSSTSLQRTLEDRMVHARGGGLTPPAGRITAIFVDDVNMPAPDSYGTQPPLELLRQAMSCGGFYDLESKSFRSIQGATYLVAAASGGGARTLPSPRLTRLFTILCVPEPDRPAMETVFNTIIMAHLGTKEFASEVTALGMAVVSATLDVYIKVAREFLPTPTHPHYTFDLRDVSKVMAGMLLAKAQSVGSEQALARLWLHESCRVFGDLLMDDCDRQSLHHAIIQALGTHFKLTGAGWTREELFELTPGGTSTPLLFGDLFGSGSVASDRLYEECGDIPRMVRQLNFHKEEYNLCALSAPDSSRRARSTPSMDLVFFPEAVSHLLRISRVLRQARGHALLLGLAGSGRESLSRMSASMAGAHWFGFNQSYGLCKFQEQLKKAMLSAGLESCSVTLFVRDSDVADEAVLEDLNCLINSGEVPGLFSAEEEAEIVGNLREAVRASGKPDTPENCRLFFAARVVSRLHVIMCMDPHDPSFRRRVRDFPGIVSCCTVDWYDPWSRSALHAVATRVLAGRVNEHDVGRACAEIHETAVKMASEYCTQLERNLCITPQTFFNFLHSLLRALDTRRCTWQERLDILGAGVVKLAETNNVVQKLRLELTGLQPQLEEKAEEVDHLLERLSTENREAVEAQARVASEEDAVFRQQSLVAALQKEAQKDLDAALPVLEEAMKSLDSLRREDITEIKSFTSPPEAVRTVMESVCLLLDEDQDWDSAKRVLGRPSFMEELRSYEKNQVSPSTRKSLKRFTQNEGMSVERLRHVSLAAAGLCMWVHAMDDYTEVYEVVKPKMQRVSELNEQLLEANRKLVQTRAEFSAVEAAVESLKCKSDAALADKAALIADIELCSRRLERAEALVSGLRDEQIRWTDSRVQIQTNEINLLGDAVLCAAFCSYLGGFNGSYRESLLSEWTRSLRSHRVHVREGWSPTADMGDASITRGWHLNGLPTDATSVENALLTMADVQLVGRWPLIVDPQRQAHRWLHATYSSAAGATGPSLMTIGASADGLVAALTLAMQRGVPLLVEDVGEILDPALQQCLLPSAAAASSKARGQIQIGEREIECDPKFRLYLTTVLANPKYVAGTAVRLNIINFTVTRSGLSEHLLHDVVRLEQPDLGKKHDALLVNIAADQQQLIDIEERILGMLNRAAPGVGILDDEDLIETLSSSKVTSMIVRERLAESGVTEAEMRKSREAYQSVAARASLLYFVLVDMARVDPMYQYSLEYFRDIFSRSIAGAADAMGEEDLSARLTVLVNAVTVGVHVAISRGLFKKHQLLFSFLISTAIQRASGSITEKEWVLLLRGTSTPGRRRSSSRLLRYRVDDATTLISNPAPSELTADTWRALTEAEAAVPGMRGLSESVASDWSRWKDWISDPAAHRAPLPFDWENRLSAFQKLLTARILAPACAGGAAREMVEQHLGKRFTGPSAAINMQSILSEMSSSTPCLFILSDESDAETALLRYAASECSSMPKVVSLGRGQGIKAEQAICTGSEQGSWVLLQNCHLAKSWLPRLEQMVSDLTDTAALAPASHPDFRLFLTAFPAPYFPVGVLQRCIKITDEPPRSVKENLRRSFSLLAEKRSLSAPLGKRLLLGLCFFHAVSQERSKYGPIGWNCAYHFSGSDLEMAAQLLGRTVQEMQLSEDTALGLLDNLVFITGNITYGGRVTDDWDRRCLLTILDHFYRSSLFGEAEQPTGGERPRYRRRLSSSSAMIAAAPHMEMPLDYEGYISQIPSEDGPDVFGMHASADMSLRLRESTSLFHDVLRLQPRKAGGTTGGGMSASATVMNTANDMLARLPGKLQFRKEGAQNYLTRRGSNTEVAGANEDPLIVVLIQELDGYNALLDRVKRTLTEVQRSIRGEIVMSTALEDVMECILLNAVPRAWKGTAGFASIKPLSSWTSDLAQRMSFFGTWLERGQPRVFHLPAFRFPHGFLTAVLQNHSRQHGIPINLLRFRHEYPSEQDISATDTLAVKEGVYVAGLSIEGGSWDAEAKVLRDPRGLEIRSPAPVIHFLPAKDYKPDADKNYICPLYQTAERQGLLSTTGVSTNYVTAVAFPTQDNVRQFIMHGTALLCS